MPAPAQPAPPGQRSERLPPYSEDAERGILGAALLDPERVLDLCRERGLVLDAFYRQPHQVIYQALTELHDQHRGIDLLVLVEALKARDRLEDIGGPLYLDQLVEATPTAAHAEYYLEIVYNKYLLRQVIDRATTAIDSSYKAGHEDAETVLSETEQSFFTISESQHGTARPWADLVHTGMDEIEKIINDRGGVAGLRTGFTHLDQILTGLKAGEMIVLAARPSMGKTALALNIVENISAPIQREAQRQPVAVFSMEMSAEALVRRMLCCRARVSAEKVTRGYCDHEEHASLTQAASDLMGAGIHLDDTAGLEAVELVSRARRLKRRYDIQLVVIDYLQLLNYSKYSREGRQREISAVSGALKAMAKNLHVPVLVLSQLSREPEKRGARNQPQLSDLRESGAIEQDADVVMFLRRPCRITDDPENADQTLAYVDIQKHRNGRTGKVRLNFFDRFTRFDNREDGEAPGGPPPAE